MLAKTPPMGWNSWNTFTKDINEEMIMQMADAMVDTGLLDAGYEYLTIDDCWSEKKRDKNGNLVADHEIPARNEICCRLCSLKGT